jgi:hypothetical protein
MSFTFHPEYMRMRVPGQVPRLDPELDRSISALPPAYHLDKDVAAGVPAKPVLRASAVASDLGLPRGTELSLTGLVKTLSGGATNEVDFRRGVMTHLILERYEPALRRAIMSRALSFFRSSRPSSSTTVATQVFRESRLPTARADGKYIIHAKSKSQENLQAQEQELKRGHARGGKFHRRVPVAGADGKTTYKYVYDEAAYKRMPEAHLDGKTLKDEYLRSAVARILDKAGDDGCEPNMFSELVARHGAKAIAGVLAAVGAKNENGRVRRSVAKSQSQSRSQHQARAHVSLHVACFGIEYEEALWKAAAFGELDFDSLSKAEPEQLPSASGGASTGAVGGGGPSPKKLPPGTRRIWHNRIVERGVDDKWHVVGHVAGLEDPGKVQPLAPHEIDPEHLKALIAKIKELLGHEKKKHDLIHAPIPSAENENESSDKPKTKTTGENSDNSKSKSESESSSKPKSAESK